ncbi:endochitinase-like [Ornithodoros turicata]|uniref:endochitinase-like n=1 Tax=Ornithodoros turicata TaxID=34597 RepID=UPI003138F4C1
MLIRIFTLLVFVVRGIPSQHVSRAEDQKPIVCYYYGWANNRPRPMNYDIGDIRGNLCTHVNLAFAAIHPETFQLHSVIPSYADNATRYKEFTSIKEKFVFVKTLLSVGGWEYGNGVFSEMARDASYRYRFVKSALVWLREYGFDGLDISWQYPGKPDRGGSADDKTNFVLLMKDLHNAFMAEKFLLTTSIPIDPIILQNGYDVASLSRYVDWFNVFAHDLRGRWTGRADVHSPLKRRPCIDEGYYKTLNAEDGLKLLTKLGAPKAKLMVGIAFYGRTYVLQDPTVSYLGAPINQHILAKPGPFVMSSDVLAYYEICMKCKDGTWTRGYDSEGQCPYAYSGDQWVGYEDPESVSAKVDFVMDNDYGGVMVFNVDMDDFRGVCGGKHPLLNVIFEKFTERYLIDPRVG